MKKVFTLLLLFLFIVTNAQIQKLSELSSNRFLDSRIIYERQNDDVYGYFFLYQKDVKSSTEIELEYVILDKNLNKIGNNSFTMPHFSYWLGKGVPQITYLQKRNDKLIINISEVEGLHFGSVHAKFGHADLRIIDLKTLEIKSIDSKAFDVNKTKSYKNATFKKPTKEGYLSFNTDLVEAFSQDAKSKTKYLKKITELKYYDNNNVVKWTLNYNQDQKSKSYVDYRYAFEDKDDIVFLKRYYEKKSDNNPDETLEFIDVKTGLLSFSYVVKGNFIIKRMFFEENKIIIYAVESEANRKDSFNHNKITGLQKIVLDRKTGKELDYSKLSWLALSKYLVIDKYGEMKGGGYIQFLGIKHTKEGKTVLFAEGYESGRNTAILDAYAIECNEKMAVTQFIEIPKFKNKLKQINYVGESLEYVGYFDYLYEQKLEEDGFVFYYVDNEKGVYAGRRNPKYVLGIVTYVDGKFDLQKINLKIKDGNIIPLKAKKGYILLREYSKKDTEFRLEKINY